jgi:hypothetical protein
MKKDLLNHPLTPQFQSCDSPTSILAVLQGQVDDLDHAQKTDKRSTKWIGPIVIVLTFSATIGGGLAVKTLPGLEMLNVSQR